LEASVEITSASGIRSLSIAEFFVLPRDRIELETVLQPGEIVSAIILDTAAAGGRQLYRKIMQRGAWDFALVSIAAARREDGPVRAASSARTWSSPTPSARSATSA